MKLSARNGLQGGIKRITQGAVNAEEVVGLTDGVSLP